MANVTFRTEYYPKGRHENIIILQVINITEKRFGMTERREHFELCKDDSTLKPWRKGCNRLDTYFRDFESALSLAKDIVNGKRNDIYTDADRAKYISNYNKRNGWGFSKLSLLATMRQHQKGDEKMKRLMEDRLEDANFHGYCADLRENDYGSFMQRIENELKLGYL